MNNFDFEIDYQAAHDQIRMLDFTKNKRKDIYIQLVLDKSVSFYSYPENWIVVDIFNTFSVWYYHFDNLNEKV